MYDIENEQDDKVVKARSEFQADMDAWRDIYNKAEDDLYFLSDEEYAQWDSGAAERRKNEGKPVISVDHLGQFIHQVVNDIRQNTPTINVIPHSSGAREETARIIKGLIKNIEYRSSADSVYDNAVDFSVKCGIGWIRVDHDYENDTGFEQELLIKPICNPTSVILDSRSIMPDGSDAKHCFVLEKMTRKDFKKRWPKFDACSFTASQYELQQGTSEGDITIAEYFYIEEKDLEIGMRMAIDPMTGEEEQIIEPVQKDVEYINTRKTTIKKVKRCYMSGKDVLEETDFPGKYIPIIPVYGEQHWAKGKRYVFSLIRKSHDSQKMVNFWKSIETEILQKTPKFGWMAAEGQTEDYAQDYINADKSVVKRYKTVDVNGNPVPAPQQIIPPQMPVGIVNASRAAVDDIKATMGIYQAALGMRSNETSGIAIAQRKAEGDNATYHFADNLSRSIQHLGRVLISCMREIYDTQRVLRIIGEEEEIEEIGVNGLVIDGQEVPHDLTKGEYDVRVVTGASYTTKRQEAAAMFEGILSRNPALLTMIGDLAFKTMDVPGAQAIADRFKKMLPPELRDDKEEQVDPRVAQAEQIIEQSQAAIIELTQRLQQAEAQLKDKQAEMALKAQSDQARAENDRAKIEIEIMKLNLEQEKLRMEAAVKERELSLKEEELGAKIAGEVLQANEIPDNSVGII